MTKQGKSIKKIKAKQYEFIHHVNVHAFFFNNTGNGLAFFCNQESQPNQNESQDNISFITRQFFSPQLIHQFASSILIKMASTI